MKYGNEEPADIIYEWINQNGWVEPCRMTWARDCKMDKEIEEKRIRGENSKRGKKMSNLC